VSLSSFLFNNICHLTFPGFPFVLILNIICDSGIMMIIFWSESWSFFQEIIKTLKKLKDSHILVMGMGPSFRKRYYSVKIERLQHSALGMLSLHATNIVNKCFPCYVYAVLLHIINESSFTIFNILHRDGCACSFHNISVLVCLYMFYKR
jgi:hypothetical protein